MWSDNLRRPTNGHFETEPNPFKREEAATHVRRAALLNMPPGIVEARRSEHLLSMSSKSEKVVICIAGLTACGKSTAARRLAERFNLKYASGGTALKEAALKLGYRTIERGWWETAEGMRFLEQRTRDPELDKRIDNDLLKLAECGNVVLDSWTMPWL